METTVDFLEFIEGVHFCYTNICGPFSSGKTSYLKAIQQYNDNPDQDLSSDERTDKHFVIPLDFSDYSGKTYEEAICFFKKKISKLYVSLYNKVKEELDYYGTLEKYLDFEEGKCDEKELRHSLVDMIRLARYGKNYDRYYYRPLITIDEISRPILYASKYGYIDELLDFYNDFLDIDHYELTAGIITTSYTPANINVPYDLKYISNKPVNKIEPLKEICKMQGIELVECPEHTYYRSPCFGETVTFEECFERMMLESEFAEETDYDYDIDLPKEIKSAINSKRMWISVQKLIAEEAAKRRAERERREYAEPLAWGVQIPSKYAGIRELDCTDSCAEQKKLLDGKLKDLYEKYGQFANSNTIYRDFQQVGEYYENADEIRKAVSGLKAHADSSNTVESCRIEIDDEYWAKIDVQRKDGTHLSDMSLVKVYVSVKETKDLLQIFDSTLRFLIDECSDLFHAKISVRERKDHICLWVSRMDFFMLENFLSKFEEALYSPLDFVPYRGKLGITREFFTWSSYNGQVSELIALYFNGVTSIDDIDVLDMYSKYVRAWNGDYDEKNKFADTFKKTNAQELIILLESLDVMLGNSTIHDESILLNSDGSMWCALGESKNWHDVGVQMGRRH